MIFKRIKQCCLNINVILPNSSSTIRLRHLGLFLPPGNHLPISLVIFLYFFSLQVCNLNFFLVVCWHPFFVYVLSNLLVIFRRTIKLWNSVIEVLFSKVGKSHISEFRTKVLTICLRDVQCGTRYFTAILWYPTLWQDNPTSARTCALRKSSRRQQGSRKQGQIHMLPDRDCYDVLSKYD